jgi:hypothetical protein
MSDEPAATNGEMPTPPPTLPPVVVASPRPELTVGAAFAGGLAFARLLKRLGR